MILTVILGLLGLGVIVFMHELGHFISARLCGVTVESFSIGWGPVLVRKKKGDTEYRLSLIPIGGYCGMKGDGAFRQALEENLAEIPREPGSFYGVSPLRRILIAFSGPFCNFLFAVLAFTIIAMVGYTYQSAGNRVILASELYTGMSSAAADAGILTGDRIVAIDGKESTGFNDIVQIIGTRPGERLSLTVDRGGELLSLTVVPELNKSTGAGQIGVVSWVDPVIAEIQPDSPAEQAGLTAEDIITAIDGTPVEHTAGISAFLEGKPAEISVTVNRQGTELTFPLTVEYDDAGSPLLGIGFKYETREAGRYSFFPALGQGVKESVNMLALTAKSIVLLFKGVDVTKAVSGVGRITVMLGEVVQNGFSAGVSIGIVSTLNFLALISISLFMMNLLPIPILDGGLILFSVIELIKRRGVSPKILYRVQFIGAGFILVIFVFALFGDIRYLFTR